MCVVPNDTSVSSGCVHTVIVFGRGCCRSGGGSGGGCRPLTSPSPIGVSVSVGHSDRNGSYSVGARTHVLAFGRLIVQKVVRGPNHVSGGGPIGGQK